MEPLQNKNAETVGRATKRAAKELTGDDGNFVVATDLGNEFATLDRELPAEAVKAVEDAGAFRADERGEELQPSARRRAAAGGRGLHDRPQHGGPGEPAEAALPAPGSGPADETQAGGCKAGRLPGASEAQDPRSL